MKRVVDFNGFKKIAKEWDPILTHVDTIEDAADHINFPHEDYPEFVDNTQEAIEQALYWLETRGKISENEIRFLHKICMTGKIDIQLGKYRVGEVTVGDNLVPPQPYLIPSLMMSILPVGTEFQKSEKDIINWYKEFETIHPFEDGNGRVGGIVLAAVSYKLTGKFIVSKKEYHYYIDHLLDHLDRVREYYKERKKEGEDYHVPTQVIGFILDKMNRKDIRNAKFIKILDETGKYDELDKLIDRLIHITIEERTDNELVEFLINLKTWGL